MSSRVIAIAITCLFAGCGTGSTAPSGSAGDAAGGIQTPSDEASACWVGGAQARRFDAVARATFAQLPFPGMAVSVIKGGEVLWYGTYGWANLERHLKVRVDTPFLLASVGKLVTATALMQLQEAGRLRLDDDINPYLPFPVRNPHPGADAPITFRMLLAHASGIADNWDQMPYSFGGDSDVPLGDYLASYLVPGGSRYDAALNYRDWAPGTVEEYSNIGYALVGYLVEVIAGQPFDDYCKEHIFRPLHMHAGWFLRDFDLSHDPPAMQYYLPESGGSYEAVGYTGIPDYPDGQLRADLASLSRFLIAFMGEGRGWGHPRLLRPETIAIMQTRQFSFGTAGIGGFLNDLGAGPQFSKYGADWGAVTAAHFGTADHVGVVYLANGTSFTPEGQAVLDAMTAQLEAEAR